jgi:hypothetical protein
MADYQLTSTARSCSKQQSNKVIQPLTKRQAKVHAFLNLDPKGAPLTYGSAKKGPNAASWSKTEGEEISRLIDSNTIRSIRPTEQPAERIKDTTYYSPQVKEKFSEDGTKTFRVRGTAGGDRVRYPGDVAARTAEMEVIKALIHSVASCAVSKIKRTWIMLAIRGYEG